MYNPPEWEIEEIKKEMKYLIEMEGLSWEEFVKRTKLLLERAEIAISRHRKFSNEEKEKRRRELKELIELPEGWDIEVKIMPYLGFDMGYEIDKEKRVVKILIYSARYPESYYYYYRHLAEDLKRVLNSIFIDLKELTKEQILAISKITNLLVDERRITEVLLWGETLMVVHPTKILLEYLDREGIGYRKFDD